jgi:lipopolysaccharide/colanic/teichoic acid biosynthesis glycosyltransferase
MAVQREARAHDFFSVSRATNGFRFASKWEEQKRWQSLTKRLLDMTLASALLAILWPVIALTAIVVRLDSHGLPILWQQRVGRDLKTFRMYKFRSMVSGAEALRPSFEHLNEAPPPLFKIRNDPRLTRVGRMLRRTSLDELPQLFNVLMGDMSLVGPRPPLVHEVHADYLRQACRLRRPPGMAGIWQVSGRSELPYEDMIRLDLAYTRDWSLLLDISILLRTIPAVITGKGAY